MRIAWGVMGYGRGHAMRTLAVLPTLAAEHDITVFAGGDAYEILAPLYPTVRIPTLGYAYADGGQSYSLTRTLGRNAGPLSDLLLRGPGLEQVEREFKARGIEVVISDSEAWTHRAAARLRIPRISFDHVGVIAWCKPHFPPDLWLAGVRDGIGYRQLMGEPDRVLISSFYDAVRRTVPRDGGYLLAYFNKGMHQYQAHVDRALRLLDVPVIVYGTNLRGVSDNLDFRPPSNEWFLHDMAGAMGVISTAGSNLIGEAMYLKKPLLVVPEPAFEQRLNAHIVERMGVGQRARLADLTPSDIDRFLGNLDWLRSNLASENVRDGRDAAIELLRRDIHELGRPARKPSRRASPRRQLEPATV